MNYEETINKARKWQETEAVLQVFEKGYSDNHTASDSALFDAAETFSDLITLLKHYRKGLETIKKGTFPHHFPHPRSRDIARETLEGPE